MRISDQTNFIQAQQSLIAIYYYKIRLIQNPNLHFSNSEPEVKTYFFSCDVS